MLVKTFGSAVYGIEAITITIEVNILPGTKYFVVGLADTAIKESYFRIESALKNCGFRMPRQQVVVNMAPADIRKEGSAYDLTIAIGVLAASLEASPLAAWMRGSGWAYPAVNLFTVLWIKVIMTNNGEHDASPLLKFPISSFFFQDDSVRGLSRQVESAMRVPQTQSAFHRRAQRNAFEQFQPRLQQLELDFEVGGRNNVGEIDCHSNVAG